MKKEILTVFFAVICVFGLTAQKSKFGITTGYTNTILRSSLSGLTESESVSGFHIGFFTEFTINEKIKIVPELNYIKAIQDGVTSSTIYLPVMLRYYASDRFFFQAGPTLDYVINDEIGLNKFGYGLAFGGGFDVSENFFISTKYTIGLNNRLELDFGGLNGGLPLSLSDFTMKFNYWHLGIGYRF